MNICRHLNQKFAHHHLHTEYSPADAPVRLKSLVEYGKSLGYKSLSITDHGSIAGWVKFAQLCKSSGIRPIFGIEAYFTPDRRERKGRENNYHLLLLAKTDEGVKNILRLSQLAYTEGFYFDPRVDYELLQQYGEGLVCTSSCVTGIIPTVYREKGHEEAKKTAQWFADRFKRDFYFELQYHCLDIERSSYAGMARLAREMGVKTLATNDVHYLRKDDCNFQNLMQTMRHSKCIKDPTRLQHEQNQLYLKSPAEMCDLFGGAGMEAVVSSVEIADKCVGQLQFGKTTLPSIEIPREYENDCDYLEGLAMKGLKDIGKQDDPVYLDRIKEEMRVVRGLVAKGMRFDRYFLIVYDYVNWARENGVIVGVGRGSGCGSLVLYCLRVTGIDPIPFDLLFERFLAEDRNEMPDIDIDFDSENGHKVYEYVCQKYGADRCARIGNIGKFGTASAIRAACKVFDVGDDFEKEQRAKAAAAAMAGRKNTKTKRQAPAVSPEDDKNMTNIIAARITKLLPRGNSESPSDKCTMLKEVADHDPDRIYIYDESLPGGRELLEYKAKYPEAFLFAESIEGMAEKHGTHASGVLITDCPIIEFAPLMRSREKGETSKDEVQHVTAFDYVDIEKLGGVKFDFLFTQVLAVFSRTLRMLRSKGAWKYSHDIDHLPLDDRKVIDLFAQGEVSAIFQFESNFMRQILHDMKPDCFDDLVAANALGRPGPMAQIPSYCARKKGAEKVVYPAPCLEPILKPTYGIMVYQEQVMRICRTLAGFTGSEADKVRKAMGKKKRDLLDQMKDKFLGGVHRLKLASEKTAETLWHQMEDFGSYAFNKSHAVAYAMIAYQGAFLKTYHPPEFMAAQLTVRGIAHDFEAVMAYEAAARAMGIKIDPLDLNRSKDEYLVLDERRIRRGFSGTKGVGPSAYEDIVKGQPYKDMYDFCMRGGAGTKSNVVDVLAENGAFAFLTEFIKKRTGAASVTKEMLMQEYERRITMAKNEKRVKGALKEEREGMGYAFDMSENSDALGRDFTL